jgi:uncharacterized membrane protein
LPALAYLPGEGGIFAPVRAVSDRTVEWLHTKKGWQYENKVEFNYKWGGVALLIEPEEQSGEVNYHKNRRKEIRESLRYPVAIAGFLLCLGFFGILAFQHATPVDWKVYLLIGTKLAGLVISSLLVWYSIDDTNPFLSKICQLNRKTNCKNILSSKAAKLFVWLSWTEIGFFYFGGGLLTLLFSALVQSSSTLQYLLILNCLAIPYTIYSIYYQAFVAREWCPLCTLVQLLLWAELITGLQLWTPTTLQLSLKTAGILGFSFSITPLIWLVVKLPLQKARQVLWLRKELNKVKFSRHYLQGLLSQTRVLPPIFEGMKVVTIGNPDAEQSLIVVSNPTCESCARQHQEIEALIASTPNIKCQFILVANNAPNDAAGIVARKILSMSPLQMTEALHNWFNDTNLTRWLKKNEVSEDVTEGEKQLDLHIRWCELAGVTSAPFIFFNEIELPRMYTIPELERLSKSFVEYGFEHQII